MNIKKTSLNKLHQDNKAKFVEFAGYEMPIQYSSGIIEEHKFTRSNSGIFDVSHMGQLFIYGDENLTNDLEDIFPLDLKNLKLNSSKYSFLMNNEAGIHDDLIITKLEEGFLIILNAACKDNDFKILSKLLNNKHKMVLDGSPIIKEITFMLSFKVIPFTPLAVLPMGRTFENRRLTMLKRSDRDAKVFSRCGRQIAMAVKAGGPDPESNPTLRRAVQNARGSNMPKDKIQYAIDKAAGS